jgi:hypothetical protein
MTCLERMRLREVRAEFSRDVSRHFPLDDRRRRHHDRHRDRLHADSGPTSSPGTSHFGPIGHFLSWRGARKGLKDVEWASESCKELSLVRPALGLHGPDRRTRLREIGESLDLKHLAGFVERVFVQKHKETAQTS